LNKIQQAQPTPARIISITWPLGALEGVVVERSAMMPGRFSLPTHGSAAEQKHAFPSHGLLLSGQAQGPESQWTVCNRATPFLARSNSGNENLRPETFGETRRELSSRATERLLRLLFRAQGTENSR